MKKTLALLLLTLPLWAQPPGPTPPAQGPLLKSPHGQRMINGPVKMNYENLDIRVLAKLVSELSGRNIVLDDRVQGKVTLLSSREMSGAEVYDLFMMALERYGYTVKSKNGYDLVLPVADARKLAPFQLRVKGGGPQPVLGLILLKNADVNQLQTALRPLVSDQNLLQAYPNARAIILVDKPSVVRKVADLARQMDQATPNSRIQVLKLVYAESDKLAPVLQQVLTRSNIMPGDAPTPKVGSFAPANSIVIQGSDEQIAIAARMIKRLDQPRSAPDQIEKPQFYVHFLQYSKAEDTAKVLSSLLGDTQDAQRKQQKLDKGNIQDNSVVDLIKQQQSFPQLPDRYEGDNFLAPGGGSQANQQIAFISSKVAFDSETNSLVFFMSPSEYTKVEELLAEIDVPRKQVLVLGMVAEVSLSRLLQTGAKLQVAGADGLLASFNGGLTEEGLLSSLASGSFTVGTLGSNNVRTINVGGREVRVPTFFAFLSSVSNTTDFNLISSPRILTSDHKEGVVEVGDVVPFATGARFDNFGQPLITYDYKKVGIKLAFTPHVSQSDTIRLDLDQQIQETTDFLRQNLGGFGYVIPLISNRSVKTQVTVKEGETLLIGGLISKRTLDVIKKVPILGDIPLIDNFFKETNKEERKTTLFIALTPYIIHHPDDVARLDRPYDRFAKELGKPSDAQHEPRPPSERYPVQEPYGPAAATAPADGTLVLENLQISPPDAGDSLRQARVRVCNRNPFEVEIILRQQVRAPGGVAADTQTEPQRLAANEEREVVLPPYRFPTASGDYFFDVSAWIGSQQVSRLPLPRKVVLK
ncbi:type II secretion system secretin GspD [bacterium]|nr:type II secretion system secretin GspD [bacterium]